MTPHRTQARRRKFCSRLRSSCSGESVDRNRAASRKSRVVIEREQSFALQPRVPLAPVIIDMAVLDGLEQDLEMFQTVPVMRPDGAVRRYGLGILAHHSGR